MTLSLIAQQHFVTMPWKNGGGTTTQILTAPEGAGLADFDWRISMARVESNGPFSIFPDIDRNLCVIEGSGLVLQPEGRGPVTLTGTSPPYAFPADLPLDATLLDGPITDLNVMTRRGRARAHVSRITQCGPLALPCLGGVMLVLTGNDIEATAEGRSISARAGDVIRRDGGTDATVIMAQNGQGPFSLIVIDLWESATA